MAEEDNRVFDVGDVVADLECVGVSYKETEEHGRHDFTYQFKLKSEVDAARKAQRDHDAEIKRQEKEAREEAEREAQEEAAHRNED